MIASSATARFYEMLEPFPDCYVFATFDEVVGDFGGVVQRVNSFFGTDFVPFINTMENVEACFRRIEDGDRRHNEGKVAEAVVGRPSEERSKLRTRLSREALAGPPLGRRLRVHQVWERLSG